MEQTIKDMLQLGFSFFVAGYLLIVMTNLIRELRENFVKLQATIEELARELKTQRVRITPTREGEEK